MLGRKPEVRSGPMSFLLFRRSIERNVICLRSDHSFDWFLRNLIAVGGNSRDWSQPTCAPDFICFSRGTKKRLKRLHLHCSNRISFSKDFLIIAINVVQKISGSHIMFCLSDQIMSIEWLIDWCWWLMSSFENFYPIWQLWSCNEQEFYYFSRIVPCSSSESIAWLPWRHTK